MFAAAVFTLAIAEPTVCTEAIEAETVPMVFEPFISSATVSTLV